ncbi:MAG TPA: alpha/beta hydrolase [Burkholderiales bacterium]|nr:alpha/beta hydrolase [Burkholderiales bacterium]
MNVEVDGKRAFAYTAAHEPDAAKPTIVFIHGAGLDHSSFGLQSRYFGYHGWNVLAVDLPGHGRSEGPPLPTIGAMADWILKLVKAPSFAVVGHSMGALISLECALRQPQRVARIALIGVAYPMKVSEPFLDAARRNDHTAYDMETIWGHAARVPLASNPNPGMWMYGDALARLRRLAPGVLHNDLKACNEYAADFSGVKCPVLLVLGKRDVMTPPRSAKGLQEKLPHARSVVVDFSGHLMMTEAPDATLDALIGFLGGKDGSKPA